MSVSKPLISFYNADVRLHLSQRRRLRAFLVGRFRDARQPLASLSYIFCSDVYLLDINNQFLQHDDLTDIITFPLHAAGEPVEAEIYISIHRVNENAKLYGVSAHTELHRVIFHGALHLLGYQDKSPEESTKMREMEEGWIASYELFHVEL